MNTTGQEVPAHGLGSRVLGTEKLSVEPYCSTEIYQAEVDKVFRNSWLVAGKADDIPDDGDYFVFEVQPLDASIVVVRDGQTLRAFHNACTHRGARLVNDVKGNRKTFSCSFHGWTFGLSGELKYVPGPELFECLETGEESLKAVSVDNWGGFVFVQMNSTPSAGLRDYLAPLTDGLDQYLGEQKWHWNRGYKGKFNCNWKLLIDAQLEGYHVDSTHANTIRRTLVGEGCPGVVYPESLGVPGGCRAYHMPEKASTNHTDLAIISTEFGSSSAYIQSDNEFDAASFLNDVSADQAGLWQFDNYLMFPNLIIFVMKGQVLIQRTWPLSADRCEWEIDLFHTVSPKDGFGTEFNLEFGSIQMRDVLTEDVWTCEGIQRNFNSGAITEINLNDQEVGVRAFYKRMEAVLSEQEGVKLPPHSESWGFPRPEKAPLNRGRLQTQLRRSGW